MEKSLMTKDLDPRTKLTVVICIATLGIFIKNIFMLTMVLIIGISITFLLRANLIGVIKKLKNFIFILFGLVIVQSLFLKDGNVIIEIGNFRILTDQGLIMGVQFIIRVIIILLTGVIISTTDMRQLIQGLVQWKLPYEIAFMVIVGIRFMPILLEEMKDTITAINLRGIDIKKIKFKEKINLYTYIFTPIVVSTLTKAKKVSISIETRAFRAYDERTSILQLKFNGIDYLIIVVSVIISIAIIIW